MPISPLPPAPSRADPATFSAKSDALLGALDQFVTETNAEVASVSSAVSSAGSSASAAATSATNAGNSATAAAASASAAAATAGAVAFVPSATYTLNQVVVSGVNSQTYRHNATPSSLATDPANDATNWTLISGNVNTTLAQTLTNKTLTNPTLTNYTETVFALSGTVIDPANGTVQTRTLAGNVTFTESIADGQSVVLMLNPATFTVTWPTTSWVTAAGTGAAPTLKASVVNTIVLWQVAGTLYGNWIGSM